MYYLGRVKLHIILFFYVMYIYLVYLDVKSVIIVVIYKGVSGARQRYKESIF